MAPQRPTTLDFIDLKIPPSPSGARVAAETLFTNPRFNITLRDHSAFLWKEHLEASTIADLIDRDTGAPFTGGEWEDFFYSHALDPEARYAHSSRLRRIVNMRSR